MRDCNVLDWFVSRLDASSLNVKIFSTEKKKERKKETLIEFRAYFWFSRVYSNPAAGGNSHCKIIQ